MLIVRLLHILLGVWFVVGLLGRWMAYAQARRAGDIGVAAALLGQSDRFERLMVMPGSQAVLLLGLLTAWLQGRPLLGVAPGTGWLLASLVLFVSLIPIVALVLAPRRRRRLVLTEAAVAKGTLTHELRAALDDQAVIAARAAELAVVAIILVLMILRPF